MKQYDSSMVLRTPKRSFALDQRTHIMGILNVTPDSFSDGGKFYSTDRALAWAEEMVEQGADIIDIGGESSRPGAAPLDAEDELLRVIPVVERLAKTIDIPISIDTYKSRVAQHAIDAGAAIINDISAMTADPDMGNVVRDSHAPIILMHMRGTPQSMQSNPQYDDVVAEICRYLKERAEEARKAGSSCVIIDPGIGFGKTLEHNVSILRRLKEFTELGYPVLVGPSRKSFIGTLLNVEIDDRLEGTAAAVAVSILHGANIVRVHDVREMKRIAQVVDALARG